jgi:hypothetical protein
VPEDKEKKMVKKRTSRIGKSATQHCIDDVYVLDVLKGIPKDIKILGCSIRFGLPIKRKKQVAPTALRKLGCNYFVEILGGYEAKIALDETTKASIKRSVYGVAKALDVEPSMANFEYILLSNGEGTGRFSATTKEMLAKDDADLRRKARMLGLTNAQGDINSLLADIHAGAYQCNFEKVEVKQISLCKKI